jgi:hypothetical protein
MHLDHEEDRVLRKVREQVLRDLSGTGG